MVEFLVPLLLLLLLLLLSFILSFVLHRRFRPPWHNYKNFFNDLTRTVTGTERERERERERENSWCTMWGGTHTQIHTHTHTYLCLCECACVCTHICTKSVFWKCIANKVLYMVYLLVLLLIWYIYVRHIFVPRKPFGNTSRICIYEIKNIQWQSQASSAYWVSLITNVSDYYLLSGISK